MHIFFFKKLSIEEIAVCQEVLDWDHTVTITPQRFLMMTISKEVLEKYLPSVWEMLTEGSGILHMK